MVFSSTTFLFLFLPLLLLLYFISKNIHWRNGVLLVFSLLFYSMGEPVWVIGMVVVTLINHLIAITVYPRSKSPAAKFLLVVGILFSLAMLVYFKYATFFVNTILAVVGSSSRMPEQHLPIGISFYTFQILTYTVDVYRGKAKPQTNFFRTLLYISCFPQLIAGPIVQYADVAENLKKRRTTVNDFTAGIERFVMGLGKKVLLANLCGKMLEMTTLAGSGQELSLLGAWLSAILYSLQLFFDFSAYSDMAIGLGRVFGFRYKENFDHPYISASITEFWRRWHMSLSSFFRDYVYIPLGGNRHGTGRTIRNLFVVWALTGLWHGASWNFVLWGIYYFVLLVLERFVLAKVLQKIPKVIRHGVTLVLIVIGWVIFYYTDFHAVLTHLLAMFGLAAGGQGLHAVALLDQNAILAVKQYTVFPLLAIACCLPLQTWLEKVFHSTRTLRTAGHILGDVFLTAVLVLSVLLLLGQSYNPFIYFRF